MESEYFQSIWKWVGAVSIRVKVLGIILGVIGILGVLVIIQIRVVLVDTLFLELQRQGNALNDTFVEQGQSLLIDQEYDDLQSFLEARRIHYSSQGHNTRLLYLIVEDEQGTVLAQTVDDTVGLPVNRDSVLEIRTAFPSSNAIQRLGLDKTNIQQIVRQVTFQLLATILVMVALGFGAAFFLTWILTHPIYELVAATHAITSGDFSRRVSPWANDEIGELAQAFNQMMVSLADADRIRIEREQLQAQFVSRVIMAQEDERKRIARELHDSTSQSLTSVLIGLKNVKDIDHNEMLNEHIDDLRALVGEILDEVRSMAWQLRPSVLDDLGLVSALQRFINDYQQRFDMQVDFISNKLDNRFSPEMETTIYRIVQESLANVARHANASTVSVILDQRRQALRIIIEDDGQGFDLQSVELTGKHLGLQGIRERAALFDGRLTIESQIGQGTSLFVEFPAESYLNE